MENKSGKIIRMPIKRKPIAEPKRSRALLAIHDGEAKSVLFGILVIVATVAWLVTIQKLMTDLNHSRASQADGAIVSSEMSVEALLEENRRLIQENRQMIMRMHAGSEPMPSKELGPAPSSSRFEERDPDFKRRIRLDPQYRRMHSF